MSRAAAGRNRVVENTSEVVNSAIFLRKGYGAAIHKIAFPGSGSAGIVITRILGSGKIERPIGGYRVHGLRNQTVLERRFVVVVDIVDDNVTPVATQIENIRIEAGIISKARRKIKFSIRSKVVENFEHGSAFTDPAQSSPALARQHGYRSDLTGRLRFG